MALTKKFSKIALGAAAAGAMAMTPATAQAQYRDRDRDGISAGEVIAGAVIIGGLAAILSSGKRDRYDDRYDRRYDDRYQGYDRNRYGGSRAAVQQCVRATRQEGRRYGLRGIRVTDITRVDRKRDGYTIHGRVLARDDRYDRYDRRDRRYNSRYDNRYDRRDSYNRRDRGYDQGSFRCKVRYGRVQDIRLRGIG